MTAAATVTATVPTRLTVHRRERKAERVAQHPDRDNEHEELVGQHGAVEFLAVEKAEDLRREEQARDGDRHRDEADDPEGGVAQPGEVVPTTGPRLAHPRVEGVVDAAGEHVHVENEVGARLVQADRDRALEDAEHDRVGAHVRQRERVVDGERCAAAGGLPQERRRAPRGMGTAPRCRPTTTQPSEAHRVRVRPVNATRAPRTRRQRRG